MKKYLILLYIAVVCISCKGQKAKGNEKMNYNKLTKEEEHVIINKGTERPFTGEYNNHYKDGTYYCRRCSSPLFKSDTKFKSGCGWPSFDDAIEGAVKEVPDKDGMRTEIVCANCKAHLGHVFKGEGFTPKNLRHCVNSLSIDFEKEKLEKASTPIKTKKAYFAGGCFWGVEYYFEKEKGVISAVSGYMGGYTENPTYKEVCKGRTNHAETVEITYNPDETDFKTLAKLFFEIHDQSQINKQGPDIGTQYRSAIFYTDEEQKQIIYELIEILKNKNFYVATEVNIADKFHEAENYHQDYYFKNGKEPYCHFRTKKFD